MGYLRVLGLRFAGLFGKENKDQELADDLESHLQMHIEDNVRAGMDAAEARRQALIKLGGVEQTKEGYRERRTFLWLESLVRDVRFGCRILRKSPGFTAVAVLILALGIGANTAIFSVINSLMLRTLPVRDPEQLVELLHEYPGEPAFNGFSWDAYRIMRDNHVFSALIVVSPDSFSLRGQNLEPQTLLGRYVSGTFPDARRASPHRSPDWSRRRAHGASVGGGGSDLVILENAIQFGPFDLGQSNHRKRCPGHNRWRNRTRVHRTDARNASRCLASCFDESYYPPLGPRLGAIGLVGS